MATKNTILGTVPKSRGRYTEGDTITKWYYDNILEYKGSSFRCISEASTGITGAPATYNANTHTLVPNAGWEFFVDTTGALDVEERLTENREKLSELESVTKPLIRISWIANGIWLNNNNNHLIFPVLPNSNVEIKVTKFGYYTFLNSYKTPVIGETPSFAIGYSDRVSFNYTKSVIAPADAQYLYVAGNKNGDSNHEILSIKIDGIERYTTLDWVATEIAAELEKVKSIVEDLDANTIKENDLSYSSATSNIANPENIINNKIVDNSGNILDIQGWSIIKVDVMQGEKLTFGGFYLGRVGYCAFYKDTEFISVIQFGDPQGVISPITVEVPSNANLLYIDIQSTLSPDNPYETLQINYGNTLKPYVEYDKVIFSIKGIPLKGATIESGSGVTIADLMVDLPISDGSDIASGFAYIDSQTKNIKVK